MDGGGRHDVSKTKGGKSCAWELHREDSLGCIDGIVKKPNVVRSSGSSRRSVLYTCLTYRCQGELLLLMGEGPESPEKKALSWALSHQPMQLHPLSRSCKVGANSFLTDLLPTLRRFPNGRMWMAGC